MKTTNRFLFKGIKQERETEEERKKRLQDQFKKDYNAYMLEKQKAIDKIVIEEILK